MSVVPDKVLGSISGTNISIISRTKNILKGHCIAFHIFEIYATKNFYLKSSENIRTRAIVVIYANLSKTFHVFLITEHF